MLIVEDGSQVAGAEAYASVADATAYFAARANAAWAALASDALREAALRQACDYIEAMYGTRWKGERVATTQALSWPRDGVVVDGVELSTTAIPAALMRANIELALKASSGELLSDQDFDGDNVPIVRVAAHPALQGDAKWGDSIAELMAAVDDYIPMPPRETEKPFLMPVEDVFTITGRGTVITGRIERGVIKVNETVDIVGIREAKQTTTVTGIEMFRKLLDEGQAGENVGLLLRGTKREDVERGMVIIAPGSTTPHTEFEGQAYILSKEEGGRHTPFFNNYRPQFYFRTTDVTGSIELPEGKEMVMPGDNVSITVKLIAPIAMEEGLRFAIREGGRTVGAGVVAKIIA